MGIKTETRPANDPATLPEAPAQPGQTPAPDPGPLSPPEPAAWPEPKAYTTRLKDGV